MEAAFENVDPLRLATNSVLKHNPDHGPLNALPSHHVTAHVGLAVHLLGSHEHCRPRGFSLTPPGAPMKRISLMCAIVMALLLVASTASAQEFTLEMGTLAPKDSPWGKLLKKYKRAVEKKTNGRVKIKIYWSGRKGDELSMVRKLQAGNLQAFAGSTGALASQVAPELSIFELPFLFKNLKEADRIIDDVLFEPVAELLAKKGLVLYIMAENGYRNFATKGTTIKSPGDLAKLKMRSMELWVHAETYRALGGNPVIMPVSEVTTGLTTGNIDGFDNTPLYTFAAGWNKQIDTWTVSDHIYQPAMVVFNKKWFDALPADIQEALLSQRKVQTKLGRKLVRKMNKQFMSTLESSVTVYRMTDAEKSAMAKKTKSVHQMYVDKVGGDAEKLLDLVYKAK